MASKQDTTQYGAQPHERVIVRYPNRKFYDTQTSSYVTITQLQAMAAQGDTLHVYSKETRGCITAQTLCQIIAQASKTGVTFDKQALLGIIHTLPRTALGRV